MAKAPKYHDGTPMKPARSRPVSRCPDLETNANGTHDTLARTVRRVFADLGERIPDDLRIHTPPGVHHAGDELILEGMTDAIPAIRIPSTYGRGGDAAGDARVRRSLLLMQRNSLRRAAFRRAFGRDPGAVEAAWSRLHHPIALAIDTLWGAPPASGRPGLDLLTGRVQHTLGQGVTMIQAETPGGVAPIDVAVRVQVDGTLPETLVEVIRSTPSMPLAAVVAMPRCGVPAIDDAVDAVTIGHVETGAAVGMSGGSITSGPRLILHLAATRFVHHPDIPADVDMGPWLDHIARHPPLH